ncbi:hypothetical protein BCY90_04585 [Agrobacterium deltaense]|uniref:hypothetical protein n=1 Tax=Rhizobium/Agrobacterium group TaxID=227290 RepID=UPI000745A5C4|nr:MULTISPECIES: hypothetical protein [Rhizobium/Agrobacterium group]KVK53772.1 hypothetical protein L901_03395 [Agrobacterium sp. D14]RKF38005.1 hypothetical protein BCY90_04585 [Agrobacterium deltaense]TKV72459.1 hypothetical protein D0C28_17890 [Rhizobium sp. AU243]
MRAIATTPVVGEDVFDVNSEIGGSFTVSIIEDLGDGAVMVRILYGEIKEAGWKSFGLFDGNIFQTRRKYLTNRRTLR